jgi:hypothetical protein
VAHDFRGAEALLFHGGQFRLAGHVLTELPRIVSLDGQRTLRWLQSRHQVVDLAEEGVRPNEMGFDEHRSK